MLQVQGEETCQLDFWGQYFVAFPVCQRLSKRLQPCCRRGRRAMWGFVCPKPSAQVRQGVIIP